MQNLPWKEHFYLPTLSDTKLKATLLSSGENMHLFRQNLCPSRLRGQRRKPGSLTNFGMNTSPTGLLCIPARQGNLDAPLCLQPPWTSHKASTHLGMHEQPIILSTSHSWYHSFISLKHINSLLEVKEIMTCQFFLLESPTFSPLPGKHKGIEVPLGTFHSASNLNTQLNQNMHFIVSLGHD